MKLARIRNVHKDCLGDIMAPVSNSGTTVHTSETQQPNYIKPGLQLHFGFLDFSKSYSSTLLYLTLYYRFW